MNRKQRRAALKQSPRPGGTRTPAAGDPASQLFAEAVRHERENKLDDATRAYKRVLALKPDHAEASNNLGVVLLAQGKLSEASQCFAQALTQIPQLFQQFKDVYGTLLAVLPPLGEVIAKARAAWPQRLPVDQLLGHAGLAAIADDPLLLCMLQSTSVRDIGLERALTSLRAALLANTEKTVDDSILAFCCAMAKQGFINEYVFATTPEEDAQVDRLKAALDEAISSGTEIASMQVAAFAMYRPLHALPGADTLLANKWPYVLAGVLAQQLREPAQELALRSTIARLTAIDDAVSLRVQQQYEENPYPRWVHVAGHIVPTTIDNYLHDMFPTAAFTPLAKTDALDVLVAGCGTGWYALLMAQKFQGAQVLAADLSLSSLSFAKRSTPASLAGRIDYAQGDILKLGGIGRSFDVIDASGVLHHMADPIQGWRILLSLLRPGGFMHLGLYSELGRHDVVAARAFIAERGYGSTPDEIRRSRQDLLETPMASLTRFYDFFNVSECRDLLFHVQEARVTIPAIKSFLTEHSLRFLGFDFGAPSLQKFRALFARNGWAMTDLDRWDTVETEYPDTFSGMYQLWVQKS